VLEQGMPRFFRRLREGIFDQQDLSIRTEELAEFLADAAERYGCHAGKFVALGFSNGANIAASLLLRRPEVLAGAVLIRAMQPFQITGVPDLRGKKVLMLNGTEDPIVPREQPELLGAAFKQAGADTALHWERAGHALTQNDVVVAREWLATYFPV
jgi:predicted esterase